MFRCERLRGTIIATLLILCSATLSPVAAAGRGTISPPGPDDTSGANKISLTVAFLAPPGQAQLDLAQQELVRASRVICDMTDGAFRISDVGALPASSGGACRGGHLVLPT